MSAERILSVVFKAGASFGIRADECVCVCRASPQGALASSSGHWSVNWRAGLGAFRVALSEQTLPLYLCGSTSRHAASVLA